MVMSSFHKYREFAIWETNLFRTKRAMKSVKIALVTFTYFFLFSWCKINSSTEQREASLPSAILQSVRFFVCATAVGSRNLLYVHLSLMKVLSLAMTDFVKNQFELYSL